MDAREPQFDWTEEPVDWKKEKFWLDVEPDFREIGVPETMIAKTRLAIDALWPNDAAIRPNFVIPEGASMEEIVQIVETVHRKAINDLMCRAIEEIVARDEVLYELGK